MKRRNQRTFALSFVACLKKELAKKNELREELTLGFSKLQQLTS